MTCRHCGSEDLKPYSTNPPQPKGKPRLDVHGWLCLTCRLFSPR